MTATRLSVNELSSRILSAIADKMSAIVPCSKCHGRGHGQWGKLGKDGLMRCTTKNFAEVKGHRINCPGTIDAVRIWAVANYTHPQNLPAETRATLKSYFVDPPIPSPPGLPAKFKPVMDRLKAEFSREHAEGPNSKKPETVEELKKELERLQRREKEMFLLLQDVEVVLVPRWRQHSATLVKELTHARETHLLPTTQAGPASYASAVLKGSGPSRGSKNPTTKAANKIAKQAFAGVVALPAEKQPGAIATLLKTGRCTEANVSISPRDPPAKRAPLSQINTISDIKNAGLKERVQQLTTVLLQGIKPMAISGLRNMIAQASGVEPNAIVYIRRAGRNVELCLASPAAAAKVRLWFRREDVGSPPSQSDTYSPYDGEDSKTQATIVKSLAREATQAREMAVILKLYLQTPDSLRETFRQELDARVGTKSRGGPAEGARAQ
ncbi:hypothetical protein HDU96_004065 [Phlyctochytrium bullatum]|nr:hypothetical protein HDU96_004065 [Phlyctochytrium bullatum]